MVEGKWKILKDGPIFSCNFCNDLVQRTQDYFETPKGLYCSEACADENECGDDTMREVWEKDADFLD